MLEKGATLESYNMTQLSALQWVKKMSGVEKKIHSIANRSTKKKYNPH